ncbi:hypothetical protein, partial [Methanohalobium sp.]|uniref:hypothetical protein n=1 Tax=Methanohalobium sp. TaxID=2837493 RepID=UPI0025EB2472
NPKKIMFSVYDWNSGATHLYSGELNPGEWYHVTAYHDGGDDTFLYINNNQVAHKNEGLPMGDREEIPNAIGYSERSQDHHANATIDNFVLWDHVPSSTERQNHYEMTGENAYWGSKINITSPKNKTYINKPDLNVTSEVEIDTWQYELNDKEKKTFSPNTTLEDINSFQNRLFVYGNSTSGEIFVDDVEFKIESMVTSTTYNYSVNSIDNIKGYCETADSGLETTFEYKWYENGTQVDSGSITTIDDGSINPSNYTEASNGDQIVFSCKTSSQGDYINSTEYTIDDTTTIPKQNIHSGFPHNESYITGQAESTTTYAENITYEYIWYNGTTKYSEGTFEGTKNQKLNITQIEVQNLGEKWTLETRAVANAGYTNYTNISIRIDNPYFINPTEPDETLVNRTWFEVNATSDNAFADAGKIEIFNNLNESIENYTSNSLPVYNNFTFSEGQYYYKTYINYTDSITLDSEKRSIKLDVTYPKITIYAPDTSKRIYDVTDVYFNMTFEDDNLYGYSIECNDTEDGQEYYEEKTDINNTFESFYDVFVFSNPGTKECEVVATDDHTMNHFRPKVKKRNSFLGIGKKGLKIDKKLGYTVSNTQGADIDSIDYIKKKDRVSPVVKFKRKSRGLFDFNDEKDPKNVRFNINIDYEGKAELRNSEYTGHVVVHDKNLQNGYWIDLESKLRQNIIGTEIKEDQVKYTVEVPFKELKKHDFKYTTESIGGVNYERETFTLNVEEGDNFTFTGYNSWNNSNILTNVTTDNGTFEKYYDFNKSHEIQIGCEETTITANGYQHMNTQQWTESGCDYDNETRNFWMSELTVNANNTIFGYLINNVDFNMTHDGLFKERTDNKTTKYYLNTGDYNVWADQEEYTPNNVSGTLELGDTVTRDIVLTPEYQVNFKREETGEKFNFVETINETTCITGQENVTNYKEQLEANNYRCWGNWSSDHTCADAHDGLFDSYGQPEIGDAAYLALNFTKPTEATNDTYVKEKESELSFDEYNFTEYPQCWNNKKKIQLKYKVDDKASVTNVSCHNGTDWEVIRNYPNGGILYDRSMNWAYVEEEDVYGTCGEEQDMQVTVKAFCDENVVTNILTRNDTEVTGIDCDYNYWFIRADYSTETYYRTLIPGKRTFEHDVYLLDLNQDTAVQITLKIKDIGSEYTNGRVKLYKYVNETKEVVIEQYLDIENRVVLWLDKNEVYEVYAINDNGEESYIGDIVADSAGVKYLTLPDFTI